MAAAVHNAKWADRYRARARLRDRYPDEFRELSRSHSYSVALRLLEEAHPGEVWVRSSKGEPSGRLACKTCGGVLLDHPLFGACAR